MKILIINGSHRGGNTDIVCDKIKDNFGDHKVRKLRLRDIEIELPDGCEKCAEGELCPNVSDEFAKEIEPDIHDFDTYIIATPTWSDGVTPLTKIFWDRIVSWCHKDRMYLKGKKLGLVTHGMADAGSWKLVEDWVKSVCTWEESIYAGALTFESGSKSGVVKCEDEEIKAFVAGLLN